MRSEWYAERTLRNARVLTGAVLMRARRAGLTVRAGLTGENGPHDRRFISDFKLLCRNPFLRA